MSYFMAPPLKTLQRQLNERYPHRDKASDGWIGDTSHQARPSDHNPDWSDGGIVRAYDIDEDITVALDKAWVARELVEALIEDERTAYVIYEGIIWQNPKVFSRGGWLPYNGVNDHRHHVHLSIRRGAKWDRDGSPWSLSPKKQYNEEDDMFNDSDRARAIETLNLLKEQQFRNAGKQKNVTVPEAIAKATADEILGRVLNPDVGTVAQTLRDSRQISRRTEVAVQNLEEALEEAQVIGPKPDDA